jgi:SulP family sulfate permease
MASVGLTEGLLTINLVDEITNKRNGNRECIAQGSQYFKWFFSSEWEGVP